ncbi:hypothetical protein BaRGS_00020674 [Batillaria attramentaria]|uniref:Uncharacterized protein n=1 Tax=Batillaria attramentaria TaxID=370345 RepID=A0ABD0KM48_9CAEN
MMSLFWRDLMKSMFQHDLMNPEQARASVYGGFRSSTAASGPSGFRRLKQLEKKAEDGKQNEDRKELAFDRCFLLSRTIHPEKLARAQHDKWHSFLSLQRAYDTALFCSCMVGSSGYGQPLRSSSGHSFRSVH